MKFIFIVLLVTGLLVFSRYYKSFPKTFKGIIARILAVIIIVGWIYLVLKFR
jgi:hypothetical protein